LSQSINQPRKTDAPFIILVTEDQFLRTGFLNGQFPLSSCCDFTSLDDALVRRANGPRPVWSWILKAGPRGFWRNWIS
jgi:fimbrial protein FimY